MDTYRISNLNLEQEDINNLKRISTNMLDTFNHEQLLSIIDVMKNTYFMNELSTYLVDDNLPDVGTEEFNFLVLANKYKGNIMERNFSFDDAKNLIHRHKRLQARLIDFMNADKRYMDMVSDISGRYITTEVLKELRNIPVEELNRDKLGIRVKSLRQNGFSTYEDIFAASVYQLSAIKGISDDGANTIKNMVHDTYSAVPLLSVVSSY